MTEQTQDHDQIKKAFKQKLNEHFQILTSEQVYKQLNIYRQSKGLPPFPKMNWNNHQTELCPKCNAPMDEDWVDEINQFGEKTGYEYEIYKCGKCGHSELI